MINMKNAERIAYVAIKECVRQEVGFRSLVDLLSAYEVADYYAEIDEPLILRLGQLVEPTVNENGYRHTPVTFRNGGTASNPIDIPLNMDALLSVSTEGFSSDDCYRWTRAFLSIHPFRDGNGRVAWMLYNKLRGTMDYPLPLPEFDWS